MGNRSSRSRLRKPKSGFVGRWERAIRETLKERRLGVLFGGISSERDVSVRSGEEVAAALAAVGHVPQRVPVDFGFDVAAARALAIDVAFLALHGAFGEDGQIQKILEEAGVPYTGSGVSASALAMDKVRAKEVFLAVGLSTPRHLVADIGVAVRAEDVRHLGFPLVVKPNDSGSSLGVAIVDNIPDLARAVSHARRLGSRALIEEYIKGRELTVGILGEKALPIIELSPLKRFFDYEAKYDDDLTRKICPAPLSEKERASVEETALCAHRALGCRDFSRADIILAGDGTPYLLEVNTIPGMTTSSLWPKAAKQAGIDFPELCERVLAMAAMRGQKTAQLAASPAEGEQKSPPARRAA